jgi:hypothetical protein
MQNENKTWLQSYLETEAAVGRWLADHLPIMPWTLPLKATAAGLGTIDTPVDKTLAQSVADYSTAAAVTVANVPAQAGVQSGLGESVINLGESVRETVGNVASAAGDMLTLPAWAKITIVAGVLLTTYELTKGKTA